MHPARTVTRQLPSALALVFGFLLLDLIGKLGCAKPACEFLDPAGRIDEPLLAREEWMAGRADSQMYVLPC